MGNDIFEVKKHKPLKEKSKQAKAAGLKSAFVVNDTVLMTTFGKGNDAILEKEIIGDEIKNINEQPRFDVKKEKKEYLIKGNGSESNTNLSSSTREIGEDLIKCKKQLEKRYFGSVFKDNIHIQLIYNILDIEKILTIHINNIVYALDNIQRKEYAETDDFIGYMNLRNSYEVFCNPDKNRNLEQKTRDSIKRRQEVFEKYCHNKRLLYFGRDILGKDKKGKFVVDKEKLYYILGTIGEVRQFCAHSKNSGNVDILYNFDNKIKVNEAKEILNEIYENKIDEINHGFLKNEKNLHILYELLGLQDNASKKELAKDFYDFVIRKGYKNKGFSIKKLREILIENKSPDIKEDKYNDVRSKFYTLFDFVINHYYIQNPDDVEKFVNLLRQKPKEEEKEMLYVAEADRLWNIIRKQIDTLKANVTGEKISKMQVDENEKTIIKDALKEVGLKKDAVYFCKIIYMMTLFMDGKEINDLLTTLINKFENIASFVEVMNLRDIPCRFKKNHDENYTMFSDSKKIAQDLRAINSFARMSEVPTDAKKILYIEAARLLGYDMSDDECKAFIENKMLDKSIPKQQHGFRNFIASNVINSSRFKYLVRYANPKKVREVANNKPVVKFVLDKMPIEQIVRYYNSCTGKTSDDRDVMTAKLTEIISNMDFKYFENVVQSATKKGTPAYNDKMQKQAIISLYLTVLFLLVKNLVYVNSRYFLAFHCCERDTILYQKKKEEEAQNNNVDNQSNVYENKTSEWCDLTRMFINDQRADAEKWFAGLSNPTRNQSKRKWRIDRNCDYLMVNISNVDEDTLKLYRNNVAHLAPMRNIDEYIKDVGCFDSYFELYHYLMQRCIGSATKNFGVEHTHPKVKEYLDFSRRNHTYCKDFVKALNSPFGYNLPRFKNLSIDALFDMHNKPESE